MLDKLKIITEKYIDFNKNNPNELRKYKLIMEILNKKNCFLNMDIEFAYSILRDLHIDEKDLRNVYLELI